MKKIIIALVMMGMTGAAYAGPAAGQLGLEDVKVQQLSVPVPSADFKCQAWYKMNDYLVEGLNRIGARTATPLDKSCRSGITIIKTKAPAAAVARLGKMGFMTAARGEGIRVSLYFYNNRADIDRLIAGFRNCRAFRTGGP